MNQELLFSLDEGGIAPMRATDGSAAFDLFVPEIVGRISVHPGHITTLDLKIKVAIPLGYAGILMPRSGMGSKKGLHLANTIGLIDSDYRRNLIAELTLGTAAKEKSPKEALILRSWEPILQLFLVPIPKLLAKEVLNLPDPGTRTGGFGSTTEKTMEAAKNARAGETTELRSGQDDGKAGSQAVDSRQVPPPSGP